MANEVILSPRALRKLDLVDSEIAGRLKETLALLTDDSAREARSMRLKSPLSKQGLIYSIRVGGRHRLLYSLENRNVFVIDLVTHQDFEKFRG